MEKFIGDAVVLAGVVQAFERASRKREPQLLTIVRCPGAVQPACQAVGSPLAKLAG